MVRVVDQEQVYRDMVLIVDDSYHIRNILKHMLEETGYELLEAANGEDAIRFARESCPHLILLDVTLPDICGYEVLAELKKDSTTKDIPVIFVTCHALLSEQVKGLKLGAVDYITKPVERQVLVSKTHTFVQLSKSARALRESNSTLRVYEQAIDGVHEAIVITDLDGRIMYQNRTFARMAGSGSGYFCEYFRNSSVAAQIVRDISRSFAVQEVDAILLGAGREFPVRFKGSSIADETGYPVMLVFLIVDQTKRIKAEAERKQLESDLFYAQKLESVGQLAAGIAHEINTPIQYVGDNLCFLADSFSDVARITDAFHKLFEALREEGGHTALLEDSDALIGDVDFEYLLKEVPSAITQSISGVERVATIVRAMKEFAHPRTIDKVPANLNQAIQTSVTVARSHWKYVAEVKLELDEFLPMIHCVISDINQVVLNLIINASDAIADRVSGTNGKGVITISTQVVGGMVEVRVKDSGAGIPEGIRKRVFDPFFTTKEVGKGSGQGLAIARNIIVNRHKGTLDFESICDEGTTFVLRLPLK